MTNKKISIAKLKCFSNNCKLCQEEEEEENNIIKTGLTFLAREIEKKICRHCDGIATF
jgi:hypothetical protein